MYISTRIRRWRSRKNVQRKDFTGLYQQTRVISSVNVRWNALSERLQARNIHQCHGQNIPMLTTGVADISVRMFVVYILFLERVIFVKILSDSDWAKIQMCRKSCSHIPKPPHVQGSLMIFLVQRQPYVRYCEENHTVCTVSKCNQWKCYMQTGHLDKVTA